MEIKVGYTSHQNNHLQVEDLCIGLLEIYFKNSKERDALCFEMLNTYIGRFLFLYEPF